MGIRSGETSMRREVTDGGRQAQLRRVHVASRELRMDVMTFVAWIRERSARAGDPVEQWPVPWLVTVVSATDFRRETGVVARMRAGWRVILTFHGQPIALVSPLKAPRPDGGLRHDADDASFRPGSAPGAR